MSNNSKKHQEEIVLNVGGEGDSFLWSDEGIKMLREYKKGGQKARKIIEAICKRSPTSSKQVLKEILDACVHDLDLHTESDESMPEMNDIISSSVEKKYSIQEELIH